MEKNHVIDALKQARENAKKRNFSQTVELIIGFKGLELKKPDNQFEFYVPVKNGWKDVKVCGLVGAELYEQAQKVFHKAILVDDFDKFKDKKTAKALARECDVFIAQANIMPKVAAAFGKFLGPLAKMPNPKAGQIVPPNANLQAIKEKIDKTVEVKVKTIPIFQKGVGKEDSDDAVMADDIVNIYNQIVHHLPAEKQNIKSIFVKLTMGKPVRVKW